MEKLQLQQKNEVLKNQKVNHLSNQGKIAMSSMIRTYRNSIKPLYNITKVIVILLVFNKLKFNLHLSIKNSIEKKKKKLIYDCMNSNL